MKLKTILLLLLISSASFSQNIKDTTLLKEVTVSNTYRAPVTAPFSLSNVNRNEIVLNSQHNEPSVLLATTPSITMYSDNGLGYGYAYYRLRGIDQTRINVTLNGVPMNEPEDQGIYFNNYPNFLSSVSNVQIIRGAGLSKSGVASYGGSINFTSANFSDSLTANSTLTFGSYNTQQLTTGFNTKNFFVQGTLQKGDGYKHNSGNQSGSVFYGAKLGKFKMYGFYGDQTNQMAWMGETMETIKQDPRFNTQNESETDQFKYFHNQLTYDGNILTVTGFYTYLDGWYDTDWAHYGSPGDWSRTAVQSDWLGGSVNVKVLNNELIRLNAGVTGYYYIRNHTGWLTQSQIYDNYGTKEELSPYLKGEIKIKSLTVYGDVQYRMNRFRYSGPIPYEGEDYKFLNWSGGISMRMFSTNSFLYTGVGHTFREPTRTDLFRGLEYYDEFAYVNVVPESVMDYELGYKYYGKQLKFKVNAYYMDFKNEIVLNGQMGPNAILLHQNVDRSYRTGLEADINYRLNNGLEFVGNGNISRNVIEDQGLEFQPVLTPIAIGNADVIYNLKTRARLGVNLRYTGLSYIDLSNSTTLPEYYSLNAFASLRIYTFNFRFYVNNITDELILNNGVMGYDGVPRYFVSAGRNYVLSLEFNF